MANKEWDWATIISEQLAIGLVKVEQILKVQRKDKSLSPGWATRWWLLAIVNFHTQQAQG